MSPERGEAWRSPIHGGATGPGTGGWGRRCVSISAVFLATLIVLALAPLWIPLGALVDAGSRGRRSALRFGALIVWVLHCELLGIAASAWLWLRHAGGLGDRRRYLEQNFRLQLRWADALFSGGRRILGLTLEVEDDAALGTGPFILFPRHVSIGDTLLPTLLVACGHGLHLRHVLKRELLWEPCLDIVGNRLPNYFVRRGSGQSETEVAAIRALATDLGADEAVLLYPEGTRFTPAKRARALEHLRSGSTPEFAARAEALVNVLPPRLAGPLAVLDAKPPLDVVFCAHTGFEGVRTILDLWRGHARGARIRAACWRVPHSEVPREREQTIDWLYANWARIDAWIDAHREASGEA